MFYLFVLTIVNLRTMRYDLGYRDKKIANVTSKFSSFYDIYFCFQNLNFSFNLALFVFLIKVVFSTDLEISNTYAILMMT